MKKILLGFFAVALLTALAGKVSAQTYGIHLMGTGQFEQQYPSNYLVNGAILRFYYTHFPTAGTTITPRIAIEENIKSAGAGGFIKVISEQLWSSGGQGTAHHYYQAVVEIQVSPTTSTVTFGYTNGSITFKP